MCGRGIAAQLAKEQVPPDKMLEHYHALAAPGYTPPRESWNVSPFSKVNTLELQNDELRLSSMQWGTVQEFSGQTQKPFNAKIENIGFIENWKEAAPCALVLNGFYECDRAGKTKIPYKIHRNDLTPMQFAGLRCRGAS